MILAEGLAQKLSQSPRVRSVGASCSGEGRLSSVHASLTDHFPS